MIKALVIIFTFLSLSVLPVFGHGLGLSFRNEVGDKLIEFEYESFDSIDKEATPFVFRLFQKEAMEPVEFTSLLVRFVGVKHQETALVARLSQDDFLSGTARLTAKLSAGDYKVELDFKNGQDSLVQTSFDHTVTSGTSWWQEFLPGFLIGLVPGLLLTGGVLAYVKGKKSKAKK